MGKTSCCNINLRKNHPEDLKPLMDGIFKILDEQDSVAIAFNAAGPVDMGKTWVSAAIGKVLTEHNIPYARTSNSEHIDSLKLEELDKAKDRCGKQQEVLILDGEAEVVSCEGGEEHKLEDFRGSIDRKLLENTRKRFPQVDIWVGLETSRDQFRGSSVLADFLVHNLGAEKKG